MQYSDPSCKTVNVMNNQSEQTITRTLLVLAEFHFRFGLIGIDEYAERVEIARWLGSQDSTADPRRDLEADEGCHRNVSEVQGNEVDDNSAVTSNHDQTLDSIELIFRKNGSSQSLIPTRIHRRPMDTSAIRIAVGQSSTPTLAAFLRQSIRKMIRLALASRI